MILGITDCITEKEQEMVKGSEIPMTAKTLL